MKYKIPLVLFLVCSFIAYPQKVLTLNEAIKIGLQKNTTFQKMANSIKVYESNVNTSYHALFPTLSGSAGWDWQHSFKKGSYNIPDISADSRSYSLGLGSSLTLFDGLSNFANISKSEQNLKSARFNLARLKEEIIFQTISFYYDIQNAKKLLKVKDDNLKWNQKNYEIIVERNKLGSVTLADVYSQQVRLGTAELELIQAKNNLETLTSNFLFYLGLDVLESYDFEDKDINEMNLDLEKSSKLEDLKGLVTKALDNRSDYKSLKLDLEIKSEDLTIAKSGHLPSLRLNSGLNFSSNKLNKIFDNRMYTVGLQLSVPIYSGLSVSNRIEYAEVEIKNKQIELDDFERELKKDLQKNYLDLQASEKRLEVSRQNVKAAEENRRIEEEKYALGSTTLLNVLIANSEYTNALSNLINSQFELMKLLQQLRYYLGLSENKKFE
jgi:outer membrane protein